MIDSGYIKIYFNVSNRKSIDVLSLKSNLLITLLWTMSQMAITQSTPDKTKSFVEFPETCLDLQKLVTVVLDSSYFFKKDIPQVISQIINSTKLEECEHYPLALTIYGFHKYISNKVLVSRYALLKADSIYNTQVLKDENYLIRNKIFLGLNYSVANDTTKSIRYYRKAQELATASNNLKMLADVKNNLGDLYLNSGFMDKAEQLINEGLSHAIESGNEEIEAFAYLTLSQIARDRGKLDLAIDQINRSEQIFKKLKDFRNLYIIELAKGQIYAKKGDLKKAIERLYKAEKIGNESNHFYLHAGIYLGLAKLFKNINQDKSLKYHELAFQHASNLREEDLTSVIDYLTSRYLEIKEHNKLSLVIVELSKQYKARKELMEIELIESNKREIDIQKEINEKKILNLKVKAEAKRFQLILATFILSLLFIVYAVIQLRKNKKLNKKISIQNKLLEDRNIELKNFAYVASHDLKAPIRSISSFASLLKRRLPVDSDPKVNEYIEIIQSSSTNMNSLITSLLEFSKIENTDLNLQSISVSQFLKDILNNLYSVLEAKNGKVTLSENLPEEIIGDDPLLRIVFQNLINNAIKFVSEDRIPVVKISYVATSDYHKFMIKDNGIGIDKANLEKVFLMFQRLNSENEFEGSGIGLATCQKIIKMHNGNIAVESTLNVGSTFTISLPKSFLLHSFN